MIFLLRAICVVFLGLGLAAAPKAAEAQPTFTKVFAPDTIGSGGTSTLTFTITNSSGTGATDLAFTDTLPAAVTIASPANASTTCSDGTLSAPDGGGTISYANGRLAPNASCTISVNVTSSTVGIHTNVTGDLTSSLGNSGTATDDLEVTTDVPGFSKVFAPDSIALGGRSTLTFTIDNSANAGGLVNLSFSSPLPGGIEVASPANAATTCGGGVLSANPGDSTISYTPAFFGDGTLAAGAICTVAVDVTGTSVGMFNSVSGDLTGFLAPFGTQFNAGPASNTIEVTGGGDLQITKAFLNDPVAPGGTAQLEFVIQNNDRNFAATNVAFTDDLNAMLAGAQNVGVSFDNTCGGSRTGAGVFSFSGGTVPAEGSCSFSILVSIPGGAADGSYPNTTSNVTGTVNGAAVTGDPATDTLFVSGAIPQLSKTFTTPSVTAGSEATMEFTITNPSAAGGMTDLTFTDDISAFLSGATVTTLPAAGFCGAGSAAFVTPVSGNDVLAIQGANLAASGSCTFTVGVTPPSGTPGGTYLNTTSAISGTFGGGAVVGPAASASLTVNGGVNLKFTKEFTSGPANAGSTATMLITIDNSEGVTDATGLSFSDDLDAMLSGAQAVSSTGLGCSTFTPGSIPSSTFSISNATVPAGGVCTFEVGVSVPAGAATGDYVNTTSALTGDGGVGDAPAQATLSVLGADDQPVILSKTFLGGPFLPGAVATLEFTIENPNISNNATGIFFTDNLGGALAGLAATSLPAAPCGAGSSISGTTFLILVGGNLTAGTSCTFSVNVQIPLSAASGTYNNVTSSVTGTVGGTVRVGDPANASLVVEASQLEITKTFVDPIATAGALARMEITVTNTTSGVLNATYTDDLNAMLPGTIAADNGFVGCSGGVFVAGSGTSNLTVTISNLPAGQSCTHRFLVQPPSGAATGSYTNTISDLSGTVGGLPITGPTATASLQVRAVGAPSFSSAFTPAVSAATQTTTLNLTIQNKSTSAISDLAFTSDLDAMLTGAVATGLPASVCGGTLSGTSFLTFSGGSLAGSANCTIPVTVQIPATAAAGSYTNTTSDLQTNGLTLTGPASAALTVIALADLSVAVTDSPDPLFPTETLTYTVEVSNAGPNTAENVLSVITPPAGISSFATSGCAEDPNGVGTCSLGSIVAGGSASYTITATVDAATIGTLDFSTDVSTTTAESDTGNNSGSTSTTVQPQADISITKTDGVTEIRAGDTLTYDIVVANAGPSTDPAVSVSDSFPAELSCSYVSTAAGGATGNTASGSGDLAETLSLPSGGSVSYTASCVVAADATGTLSNTATAAASVNDPDLGNNSATDADTAVIIPDLGFAKSFAPAAVSQGQISRLTLTIDNSANALPADALAFSDNFPAGLIIASPANLSNSCGGTLSGGAEGEASLALSGGSVAIGASCTVEVDVRAIGDTSATNTTSDLTSTLPTAAAASATLTINPAGAPGFAKDFAPATVNQGQISTLTISLDNSANAIEAEMMAFSDDFPAGLIVATPANLSNTCGGALSGGAEGDTSLALSDVTLAAGDSCAVSVDVRAIGDTSVTNTTSDLTSTLPTAAAMSATLTITPASAPALTKLFTPDAVIQGETSVLQIVIDNSSNDIEAEDLSFSDTFPEGLVVASPANLSNSCGGTLSGGGEGETSLALSGGTVFAGEGCVIEVTVRALAADDVTNTTSDLTSTLPTATAAAATLSITGAAVPGFAKSFTPASVSQGDLSVLSFTIDNTGNAIEAADLSFSDAFPDGLIVASPAAAASSCGGTVTATPGETSISFAGGTVAEAASCTIDVSVQALLAGSLSNTSSALSSTLGSSDPASATLTVTARPLGLTMSFVPSTIEQFGQTTVTYTLTNTAPITATDVSVQDSLPAGVTITAPNTAGTTCVGGVLSVADGGSEVSYSGGSVPAGSSCTISARLFSDVVGSYPNMTESASSSLGVSAPAQATLTVEPATTGTLTIIQNTDTDGGYVFSSDTPALNFTILTSGGTGRAGPIRVSAGRYELRQSTPDGVGNTSISCNDTDSTGQARDRILTVNIDALEAVTCTITSISSRQKTVDTINRFLTKRADLILSSEPSNNRRFNRLKRGAGGSTPLSFANGDLNSFLPFTAQISTASDSYALSTSFLQMREAAASLALAHGDQRGIRHIENYRWDAWFEAQYKKFDAGPDSGHFAIAYLGADYLVNDDLLIGALVQIDDMEDSSSSLNSSVEGTGWMFGPYMTARLAPNLYFDGRVAAGTSRNQISPFNTYSDEFSTNRWMAMAGLTGDFKAGNWSIQPGASLSYFEEKQNAYVDSIGVAIPSQVVSLGQVKIGPTFTGQFQTPDGMNYSPYMSLDAIYNFGDTKGVTVTNTDTASTDGWRGRVQAGVDFNLQNGTSISLGGSYDGIGRDSLDIWGLSFELNIPIQKDKVK